ncbi:hypothetical protein EIJ50_18055, partial [Xanthomonas perforans]
MQQRVAATAKQPQPQRGAVRLQHAEALRAALRFAHHARGLSQSLNEFFPHVPPPKEVVELPPIPLHIDAIPHESALHSVCM